MINYMQSNNNVKLSNYVIDNQVWRDLTDLFIDSDTQITIISEFINNIIKTYNIDEKNLIKDYFNYIVRYEIKRVNYELLKCSEFIIHISCNDNKYLIAYFTYRLHEILSA